MCKKTKTAGVNSDILPINRIGGELTWADDVLIGSAVLTPMINKANKTAFQTKNCAVEKILL